MVEPYVIVSTAMSIDGYIDDASDKRLLLSNNEDFDLIDALRAECDAILVGANTIRTDDPRLMIRSEMRQRDREERGLPPHPKKVTMTKSGRLDSHSRFFQLGDSEKLVYCGSEAVLSTHFGKFATIINADCPEINPKFVVTDLSRRGVRRLLVEGGSTINTMFFSAGLVDELRLAIVPFFVGDNAASRFVQNGQFPYDPHRLMKIKSVDTIGDTLAISYLLLESDE